MRPFGFAARMMLSALLALVLSACRDSEPEAETSAPGPGPASAPLPPTWEQLSRATYQGLPNTPGPITLRDGKWEHESFLAGQAVRNVVFLVPNSLRTGQITDSEPEEAVVILAGRGAAAGEMLSLAVMEWSGEALENVGTALIGDRTQVRAAGIEDRQIVLDLVQASEEDNPCCPGDLVRRTWELAGPVLREARPPVASGRLGPETIGAHGWVLREWDYLNEPAAEDTAVTLSFGDGFATGSAGCNEYRARLESRGPLAGQIRVSAPETTQNLCPTRVMFVEERFLEQLAGVASFSYMMGRLALSYQAGEAFGTMVFEAAP